ncbi:hypothetical protein JZ751_001647 [Albula glossodonta]|uniref:Tectonic-1-3 domain-containing protein n=1 Tax=Albula glossodonta TaxID=121402 RepID=A0A8T2PUD4_9TELE|nr:hypothetical protein JZ751_001647 [Albula glossodonta]
MCAAAVTRTPKRSASFQSPELTAPLPINDYRQGDPVFTASDQYFTIPQRSLVGQCLDKAPVAFLQNFQTQCVTRLQSCPTGPPLLTSASELSVQAGGGGPTEGSLLCENVTVALHYTFFWSGNGLTNITLVQTVADVPLDSSGYQIGLPVIGGSLGIAENDSWTICRAPISLWQPAGEGLCASADTRPVLFGENATAGCLLPLSLKDLAQCSQLRIVLIILLISPRWLLHPLPHDPADVPLDATDPSVSPPGTCTGVPSHLKIHIISTSVRVQGVPSQNQIQAVEVRFQINFTEYDCDRNDVCWPQLAYPLTRYYTGEPYSQSLAKGLILVFFFIAASVLGTPWRQIRQAWNSAAL